LPLVLLTPVDQRSTHLQPIDLHLAEEIRRPVALFQIPVAPQRLLPDRPDDPSLLECFPFGGGGTGTTRSLPALGQYPSATPAGSHQKNSQVAASADPPGQRPGLGTGRRHTERLTAAGAFHGARGKLAIT